jgi:ATP-binding cassette subfamily B protein
MKHQTLKLSDTITYTCALALPFKVIPIYTVLGILQQVISLAIAPISVLVAAYFIDTALLIARNGWENVSHIILPLVVLGSFQVYAYLQDPLRDLMNTKARIKTQQKMRMPLIEKRARLSFKHLENNETLNLLDRVWKNPESQLLGIFNTLAGFILLLGTTVSYIIILFTHAWLASSLLIALSVPLVYLAVRAGRASYQAERETTERNRMHWVLTWYLTGREPAGERILFGYAARFSDKFIHYFESVRKWQLKIQAKWAIRSKSSSVILIIISAAALFILAPEVAEGRRKRK